MFVLQRKEEIEMREAAKKKKKKEREERLKALNQTDVEEEDEEKEEELPPIYIPDPPSPLYCGFYSQPGHFWLSMVHYTQRIVHEYVPMYVITLRMLEALTSNQLN